MAVYFFTEYHVSRPDDPPVKIGYSKNIFKRQADLQTGNPRKIEFMGHIESVGVENDRAIERDLHRLFQSNRLGSTEWFDIFPEDVKTALKRYSSRAYIAVGSNAFEIVSYDRKGIPEFASPWNWGDFDPNQFCPACGWACGWTYSENLGSEYCIECGANETNYGDARDE